MRLYRISDRHPKRPWRRKKGYTMGELRWLAKRSNWLFRHHKKRIEITLPDGRVLAHFLEVEQPLPARPASERLIALAALSL